MKHAWSVLTPFLLCVAVSACAEAPDDPEGPVPDDTVFFDTVVTMNADGTAVVSEPHAVTAGEQRAQNELRRAVLSGEIEAPPASFAQDASCQGASLWLYWRTDWTGPRICFQGSGYGYLGNYTVYILVDGTPIPISDWQIQSGSYWPGSESGGLDGASWFQGWSAWGPRRVLGEPSAAQYVELF